MNAQTTELFNKALLNGKKFRGMKFPDVDLSDKDLRNADFRGCSMLYAKFNRANLMYANFEGANLFGADFTDANLHRVNLKDCNLSNVIWAPSDCYGVTLTLECKSFQGMKATPGWWYSFLFYGLVMEPPDVDARDRLIQCLGVERWAILREKYATRVW